MLHYALCWNWFWKLNFKGNVGEIGKVFGKLIKQLCISQVYKQFSLRYCWLLLSFVEKVWNERHGNVFQCFVHILFRTLVKSYFSIWVSIDINIDRQKGRSQNISAQTVHLKFIKQYQADYIQLIKRWHLWHSSTESTIDANRHCQCFLTSRKNRLEPSNTLLPNPISE